MELFYCGNQWGYTPIGSTLNIPTGFCLVPTNLSVRVHNQWLMFHWNAPHDYLYFTLRYREVGSGVWITVDVYGTSYNVELDPETEYEWEVKTVCSLILSSAFLAGPNATTGTYVAGCLQVDGSTIVISNMGGFYRISWTGTGA